MLVDIVPRVRDERCVLHGVPRVRKAAKRKKLFGGWDLEALLRPF